MDLTANRVEPMLDWMLAAFRAINRLPDETCMDPSRKDTASLIVATMEADCIPCPTVKRDKNGWVKILFVSGDRSLEFVVTAPDVFQIFRFSQYERSRKTHHKGWPGNVARDAIRWLYPSSHATVADEDSINEILSEGL